jgi:hypothetical protein
MLLGLMLERSGFVVSAFADRIFSGTSVLDEPEGIRGAECRSGVAPAQAQVDQAGVVG